MDTVGDFPKVMSESPLSNELYKLMHNQHDVGDLVLKALDIFLITKMIPPYVKQEKSEERSTELRNEGNRAFMCKMYKKAFELYNRALLLAPKNSLAMKLAYSNRSALLIRTLKPQECINDINTCFTMGCPPEIQEKLKQRKRDAAQLVNFANFLNSPKRVLVMKDIFKLNAKRNPQIPCATTDVGVIVEAQIPKIVAANDIKVGQVVAIEKPFVIYTNEDHLLISCYFCTKMALNLIPCDTCCVALFCSENCMKQCNEEYHNIECKLMGVISTVYLGPLTRLNLLNLLKLKNMLKTWGQFIEASKNMGVNRIRKSTVNEIYDVNNINSSLCSEDEREFVYGQMYNASFGCALTVYFLDKIPSFMPEDSNEKLEAKKAVGRLLMYYTLYAKSIELFSTVERHLSNHANYGCFAFASKLRNSCIPNILPISLHNKVALVAVSPIKRGTELTISFVTHWLYMVAQEVRVMKMTLLYGKPCCCIICSRQYLEKQNSCNLTEQQRKCFNNFIRSPVNNSKNCNELYETACKTLQVLQDIPYSKEYKSVFMYFRSCLLAMQDVNSPNVIVEDVV